MRRKKRKKERRESERMQVLKEEEREMAMPFSKQKAPIFLSSFQREGVCLSL